MDKSVPALIALALTGVLGTSRGEDTRPLPATVATSRPSPAHAGGAVLAEHRYRILGKLRLAVVWAGRDNVGSARMTWRSDGTTSAVTLLVGSNPERAPRSLNEWGYLREEVRSERAEIFTLRSLGRDQRATEPPDLPAAGPVFGVSCASFQDQEVRSTQTTVQAGGVTYWMFDRLLDRIAVAPGWREQHTTRPAGAHAGFLTALQQVIGRGETDAELLKSAPPAVYVHNNVVYELRVRDSRMLGRTTVGTRTFDRLIRTDFAIRNRTTGDVSKFGVTYLPDPSAPWLPVQIFFQPSFWLRVELQLDDTADVPADPSEDRSVLMRIRAICAGAGRE